MAAEMMNVFVLDKETKDDITPSLVATKDKPNETGPLIGYIADVTRTLSADDDDVFMISISDNWKRPVLQIWPHAHLLRIDDDDYEILSMHMDATGLTLFDLKMKEPL